MSADVPLPSAVLRTLGQHNLLFSEVDQRVYELDDLTAFVWKSLQKGMLTEVIVEELIAAGLDGEAATCAVHAALGQLSSVERPDAVPKPRQAASPSGRLASFAAEIAGVVVQLHLSDDLLPEVTATLGHLRTTSRKCDCELFARQVEGKVEFLLPGRPMWQYEPLEFIPVLKAELLEQVLRLASYEVALHTAALVRNDEALLLAGSPGAGKTTLALALTRAGLAMAADDVVLMDTEGLVTGLAFPLTAKASSWPLIDEHWPELPKGPTYRRPDGYDVRYILPEPIAPPRPWRIGSVVLLDRRDGAETRLEDIEPTSVFAALLAEGTSRDQQLSTAGFTALVSALGKARCARLSYCDLIEGADVLRDLCA